MSDQNSQPIFRPLSGDDSELQTNEIESLCINCKQNGITRLLLTKIPFYKEVILMSFHCDHCGYQNNEIQSGGTIDEKGIRITLNVKSPDDLNRQIVKTDYTSIRIPHLDFEIPSRSQKGEITTVESIIDRSIQGLEKGQSARREQDIEVADRIDLFLSKFRELKSVSVPFTMIIEDISGNSFVSNPKAPFKDSSVVTTHFVRNDEQNSQLGIYGTVKDEKSETKSEIGNMPSVSMTDYTYDNLFREVMQFPTNCASCGASCETNMKMTNIPYFKDVVIMATNCEACGLRTNEVKSGGGIEPLGIRYELKISKVEDLTRDVLKSETCKLEIPEIEVEMGPKILCGKFTTVEGLLSSMKEQIQVSGTAFLDSESPDTKKHFNEFLTKMDSIIDGSLPITLVLDDPAGNSYVQKMNSKSDSDEGLMVTQYERSFEQNEELGLNDMKTENYKQDS